MSECLLTLEEVRSSFIAAPPAIQKEIRDFTFRVPNFFVDLPRYETWPLGEGTTKVELDFKGSLPEIEQGFNKWGKIGGQVGCEPVQGPGCGYNMTKLKGYGIQQRVVHPMSRELVTEAFCIKDIQTTLQYKQVFAKLIENIQRQVSVFKEYNVVFNYITLIAKKYVVDSSGLKPNSEDPFVYRNIGTARISNLNPYILDEFYQWLSRMVGVEPIAYENNMPLFAVAASSQVFNRMYLDNPKLREDLRFSGMANDIITKYNFVSKIQGQFIPVSIQWPRRFNIVDGEPMVVTPWVGDIPANYGTYSDLNPAYLSATHEEVLIFGKTPFTIYTMPTETNLGFGATFGPEPSYFDYWEWVNPKTALDPLQRFGYFISAATIGLSSTYSEGVYGLLVERPRATTIATFFAEPECPPTPVVCDNDVPAVGCPCPFALSVYADPFTADTFTVVFSAPIDAVATDTVDLATDSGGFITATVADITSDGHTLSLTVDAGVVLTSVNITGIFCDDSRGCSAEVLGYDTECTDATQLGLTLSNPVKADVGDTITVYFGDGTNADVTIVSISPTGTVVVDLGGTDFCDQVDGVLSVCVPTATEATCPGCGGPVITQCS